MACVVAAAADDVIAWRVTSSSSLLEQPLLGVDGAGGSWTAAAAGLIAEYGGGQI